MPRNIADATSPESGWGDEGERCRARRRVTVDSPSPERGLASLVLTVVELVRQLMERQAVRRIGEGDLSDAQVERLGLALLALDKQLTELREHFGLTPADLNLDLGPLGPLLPRD